MTARLEWAIATIKATTELPRDIRDDWSNGWHDCLESCIKALEAAAQEAETPPAFPPLEQLPSRWDLYQQDEKRSFVDINTPPPQAPESLCVCGHSEERTHAHRNGRREECLVLGCACSLFKRPATTEER